jgi:hypothetical protein
MARAMCFKTLYLLFAKMSIGGGEFSQKMSASTHFYLFCQNAIDKNADTYYNYNIIKTF